MHTLHFIRSALLLLLSFCLGGVCNAQAAQNSAEPAAVVRGVPTERSAPVQAVAKADIPATARGSQGRILFILASSKVHGKSALPASISFGEVVHAWDTFRAAGYAVDFVSPDGGAVPILDSYVSADLVPRLKDAPLMDGLRNTARPAQIDPALYRAVYYVGGSNALYGVPENPVLQDIAMYVYERNGGVISAVCHGTAGIVNLTLADGRALVAGKRITGFPEEHEEQDAAYFKEFPFLIRRTVQARGGSFHAQDGHQPYIEVDGRVATGQNYASAKPLAEAVVGLLRKLAEQSPGRGATQG
ncbi:type 1 glutamine amidotransferase domain-containing protein [Tahibacter harae]|uniref:Type 1 glutamine amidotransferase domain-containing protein n=1 Tax=Tahibacter harae TaxID=2963937 RepID=A0ABT1QV08_9GAMM|nr:type 1 glutamine amidotransferase domain-containing protein [Tahibacter harae]MCQ4166119.1 type 1 glutamine amidotransferase domain-containing protein [Tahibacter harae]